MDINNFITTRSYWVGISACIFKDCILEFPTIFDRAVCSTTISTNLVSVVTLFKDWSSVITTISTNQFFACGPLSRNDITLELGRISKLTKISTTIIVDIISIITLFEQCSRIVFTITTTGNRQGYLLFYIVASQIDNRNFNLIKVPVTWALSFGSWLQGEGSVSQENQIIVIEISCCISISNLQGSLRGNSIDLCYFCRISCKYWSVHMVSLVSLHDFPSFRSLIMTGCLS